MKLLVLLHFLPRMKNLSAFYLNNNNYWIRFSQDIRQNYSDFGQGYPPQPSALGLVNSTGCYKQQNTETKTSKFSVTIPCPVNSKYMNLILGIKLGLGLGLGFRLGLGLALTLNLILIPT